MSWFLKINPLILLLIHSNEFMKRPFLLLLTFLLFSGTLRAQVDYTIGTGTGTNTGTGYPTPYGDFFEGTRTQFLFRASELTAAGMSAGMIIGIKWNVTATNGAAVHENWEMKIGTTTATALTAYQTGLTTVVSATNYTPATGVNTHPFSAPFFWNGTSNIVIDVCHGEPTNATGTWFTNNASVPFTVMPYNASITFRGDNGGNGCGNTTNNALSPTNRPNTIFTLVSNPCVSPPTAGTLTASSVSVCQNTPVTFRLTGHSLGLSQTYQLQTSTTATGTYTNLGTASNSWVQTITPTATLFYRMAVTCGTSTVVTAPVQVVVNGVLPSGVYTINPAFPTAGINFASFTAAVDALRCGITGPVTFNVAPASYNEQVDIPSIPGSSATNRIVFQSTSANVNDVNLFFNAATGAANNHVVKLTNASFFTFRGMTFSNSNVNLGRVLSIAGSAGSDSFLNCNFYGPVTGLTTDAASTIFANTVTGAGNVFYGNDINNGSQGVRIVGSTATLPANWIFENNTVTDALTHAVFLQNTSNLKFRNNELAINSIAGTQHCLYAENCDNAFEITRNKMFAQTAGNRFGMQFTGCDGTAANRGLIANNIVVVGDQGTIALYGIRTESGTYQRYYNNSVNVNSGANTGAAAFFTFNGTSNNNDVRNNIFQNVGVGPAIVVTDPTASTTNVVDYNNIYSQDSILAQRTATATLYKTLSAWRIGTGMDRNSISYDAGFTNFSNLVPDPNNPASWSVNGRGIHMANNADITGMARVTALADGVPDLGAYEFTPMAVPPVAVAVPAMPEAGITQYFLFGQDTVAALEWATTSILPNSIAVRQYTGTVAPGLTAVTGTSFMYFYTDIDVLTTTYNFNARIYYKDPWTGTVSSEANMRMIKKFNANPWIEYNNGASTPNTGRNFIAAPGLTSHGYFTGVDNGLVFSSHISPNGKVVFCPGGTVTLQASPNSSSYTYQWKYNGFPIPSAITPTYAASVAGLYEVDVIDGSKTAVSSPVEVYVVAPPSTVVTPSGSLRFCAGGNVGLNVSAAPGTSYQWVKNGVDINGANSPGYTATTAGTYTVKAVNIGCAAVSGPSVVSIGAPIVNLGRDTVFCQQAAVMLDAGNPGATYLWSTGETTQTISVNKSTSGSYAVRVTAGPGCETEDTITLTVDPLPVVIGITFVGSGNTYQLSPGGVQNANRYLWIFGDGRTDTTRVLTYSYNYKPGSVKLVVFNGCGSDTAEASLTLSVNDIAGGQAVYANVFPNPAQSVLNVAMVGDATIKDLTVLNSLGQVVYRATAESIAKEQRIDIGHLPNGHYILRVHTDNNNTINKQFDVLR
ncbi:MAG: T9SS type A sorting domain-containing protein [Sphingobacteriales bacterium]|nr:MAG: T9SS type A sorting domain-containing protein [Sphingobacteriales bacterium]